LLRCEIRPFVLFNTRSTAMPAAVRAGQFGTSPFWPAMGAASAATSSSTTVGASAKLAAMGMPKYDDLSVEDMRAIFMYVRHGARQAALSVSK